MDKRENTSARRRMRGHVGLIQTGTSLVRCLHRTTIPPLAMSVSSAFTSRTAWDTLGVESGESEDEILDDTPSSQPERCVYSIHLFALSNASSARPNQPRSHPKAQSKSRRPLFVQKSVSSRRLHAPPRGRRRLQEHRHRPSSPHQTHRRPQLPSSQSLRMLWTFHRPYPPLQLSRGTPRPRSSM